MRHSLYAALNKASRFTLPVLAAGVISSVVASGSIANYGCKGCERPPKVVAQPAAAVNRRGKISEQVFDSTAELVTVSTPDPEPVVSVSSIDTVSPVVLPMDAGIGLEKKLEPRKNPTTGLSNRDNKNIENRLDRIPHTVYIDLAKRIKKPVLEYHGEHPKWTTDKPFGKYSISYLVPCSRGAELKSAVLYLDNEIYYDDLLELEFKPCQGKKKIGGSTTVNHPGRYTLKVVYREKRGENRERRGKKIIKRTSVTIP